MASHSKLYDWLSARPIACFFLMTASFLLFGIFSLDLVKVFSANANYISENGWMGLVDGGLQQFFYLCLSAIGAMLNYVFFKLCEHVLTDRLATK